MELGSAAAVLKARLTVAADERGARFRLRIEDVSGQDRGLLVRVSLPLDAVGWRWWDDIGRQGTIVPGRLYEDVKALRGFAVLPEWKDKPDLRMGFNTPNFCTVLSGPVGLCLAVPLDQPRIFRTAYDARNKTLSITYDVALCRETAPPAQAAFEFESPGCDVAGLAGLRWTRITGVIPTSSPSISRTRGWWIAFTRLDEIDNVSEFGVAIQEGGASYIYDDKERRPQFQLLHACRHLRRRAQPPPRRGPHAVAGAADRRRRGHPAASTGRDSVYAQSGLHNRRPSCRPSRAPCTATCWPSSAWSPRSSTANGCWTGWRTSSPITAAAAASWTACTTTA